MFPGAAHNRFEHSVGVCHLAEDVIQRFQVAQPSLEISEDDVEAVRVAGLCHDLGHGPFSHVFDAEFIPRVCGPNSSFKHEQMRCVSRSRGRGLLLTPPFR